MYKKHSIYAFIFSWAVILLLASCGINKSVHDRPDISRYNSDIPKKTKLDDSTFIAGNNFFTKNKQGLWELYVEGDPLERGLITGSLTDSLIEKQESVFLNKVKDLVPSESKRKFLSRFLAWYNRKLGKYVPDEYKAEIYGVSRFASENFNEIAPPYMRSLYLHGAHDIGHALQDLALVGCTSFAAWGENTEDGKLIIGRNFDFYAGDAFAEEKIIAFVNPETGFKFMSVTWGGMIGVVSGMNEKGLTVTINAGKSKVPLVAKTPVSIVTREILQYASTIKEAIAIAKKREVFVSEAIFIGSAIDKKAALIEISPRNFGVYEVENSNRLICSNHFQSDAYRNDRKNRKHIKESHSMYRFDRMEELLQEHPKVSPEIAVNILRNKEGLDDKTIGYGNEKALNQLLAHHAVVFKPEELLAWVSSNPYQLGEFVAYDLSEVFKNREAGSSEVSISKPVLNIEEDPFMYTQAYNNYEAYRVLEREIESAIERKDFINNNDPQRLIQHNPEYWKAHYLVGRYYYENKRYAKALKAFRNAGTKEITTLPDVKEIDKFIRKSKRKAK